MAKSKSWTLLLYLAGDNNLDAAGTADIMEMKTVGSTDDVNVVVQYDRAGTMNATNRYYVRRGTAMPADVVKSLGETNTGDPQVLSDFIAWGVGAYPADHYLLGLWNHGAGWDDSNLYEGGYLSGALPPLSRRGKLIAGPGRSGGAGKAARGPPAREGAKGRAMPLAVARAGLGRARRAFFASTAERMMKTRALAFDDQARDFLDNLELKRVAAQAAKKMGGRIDIVGFDACLMSMVEVAWQLRDAAGIVVASEETEPGDGWPYDRILKGLSARPAMTPAELSALITREYLASYGKEDNVTLSATDCSLVGGLAEPLDALAASLEGLLGDSASRAALMTARVQAQEYSPPYDDYCDLVDLCSLVSRHAGRPGVASACNAVSSAATRAVIDGGSKGPKVTESHGLSIYFPKKRLCPLYGTLDFGKTSSWPRFLAAYVEAVQRRPAP